MFKAARSFRAAFFVLIAKNPSVNKKFTLIIPN